MNEHLRRIQLVTRYYDWLQGLRFLPIGLVLLGAAGWLVVVPVDAGHPPKLGPVVMATALPVALLAYAVMGGYYRRRFGDVRPSAATVQTRRRMMLTFVLVGLLLSQGLVLLLGKRTGQGLPMALAMALGAGAVLAYWAWMGRFVPHYPPIAAVMLVLAGVHHLGLNPLCTLLHPGSTGPDWRCDMATFHLAWGLAIIAMSLLDHRLLVRTLRPVPVEAPESEPEEPGREATG